MAKKDDTLDRERTLPLPHTAHTAHSTSSPEKARSLLAGMLGTWVCSLVWGYLFLVWERPVAAMLCWLFTVLCLIPLFQTARALAKAVDPRARAACANCVKDAEFHLPVLEFALLVFVFPFALHVSFGGFLPSAFIVLWTFVAPALLIVYNVPLLHWGGFLVFGTGMLLCEMCNEFSSGLVDAVPGAMRSLPELFGAVRSVIPCEQSVPQDLHALFAILNFFTPAGIIFALLKGAVSSFDQEQRKSDQLLANLVPPHIAEALRAGIPSKDLTERHRSVTCFFSDVVGFTEMSARLQDPARLIRVLDDMYSVFDKIAEHIDVFKVETIGDAYFCVGGVHHGSSQGGTGCSAESSLHDLTSAHRIALFSLAVREFMRGPFGRSRNIKIRIGLHTGDVVTGVLGTARPRYVLCGDTVNTASRMESTGTSDAIHVSGDTMLLLRDHFVFTKLEKMEVKGKGMMQTYELERELEGAKRPFLMQETAQEIAEIASRHLGDTFRD